jgi:hypothetical protein
MYAIVVNADGMVRDRWMFWTRFFLNVGSPWFNDYTWPAFRCLNNGY